MTIQVVRQNHCVAGAVRSIHDSFVRHLNPLAIDPHAIVTLPGVPLGIVDALCIAAVAARSLAAVQNSHTNCSTRGAHDHELEAQPIAKDQAA